MTATGPADAARGQVPGPGGSDAGPGPRVGAAIRRLREAATLSLSELARRSGVGKATLSQLEAGERNPTLDTLYAITTALRVPLGAVLEASGQQHIGGTAVDAILLDRHHTASRAAETYRLMVRPVRQQSAAHLTGTTETLVVVEGRLRTGPIREPVELGPGQSATFQADVPHLYQGIGGAATCLLVMTSPSSPPAQGAGTGS